MPQTLQAIGAIFLLGLLSLSAGRLTADEDRESGKAESELRALGVAEGLLDRLTLLPFDAAVGVTTASGLTPPQAFGSGGSDIGAALDLDDVQGGRDTVSVARDGAALWFGVATSVRYVKPVVSGGTVTFVAAAGPTFHKEVEARVRGPLGSDVRLRRVYTYAPPTP